MLLPFTAQSVIQEGKNLLKTYITMNKGKWTLSGAKFNE